MKELKNCTNEELNEILEKKGLNPCIKTDEDIEIAINIISQLNPNSN